MINKKNLWFLTLFSLVLVLSIYYVTMPQELLLANNDIEETEKVDIEEKNIIEVLKQEDNAKTLDSVNELKNKINESELSTEEKNKVFDAIKLLNQISSQEELLEEKIKNTYNLDSFIKIEDDQIRVVINESNHDSSLANNIMRTIQNEFDTKKYISIQFK